MSKTKEKKKGGSQADGTRRSYFMYRRDEVTVIGLDTKDGPEHPAYDERILIPLTHPKLVKLIASIKKHGVRESVKFKRDGDRNIIEDGRQRVRCAEEATRQLRAEGLMKAKEQILIPSIPWQGSHEDLFAVARSVNACRVDNEVMANAREARRLLGWGKAPADVAEDMGVTKQTIDEWIAVLGATPAIQRAVARFGLSSTAAARLAKLPSAEQAPALADLAAGGAKPTIRAVKDKLRADQGKPPTMTPSMKLARIDKCLQEAGDSPNFIECRAVLSRIMEVLHPSAPAPDLCTIAKLGKEVATRVIAARPPLNNADSAGHTCQCGHAEEEHGNDPDHPGSTSCEECPEGDCIAYEADS